MKKLFFILCIIFLLSLPGCGGKESPAPVPTPTAEATETAETAAPAEPEETTAPTEAGEVAAPSEEEEPVPTISDEEIPKAPVIETKYYTLSLPDEWKETCVYTVTDGIYLTLREKSSYEAFGGGKLCTLLLMRTEDDTYQDFPDYKLLCALDTPEGSFHVIALFPTDVQFNEDTIEAYNAMADGLMDVLYTLQPKDGIEMAMP